MSSIQEFSEEQLSAARAKAWHQSGEALLTLEAAKDWINERGLVLFAPRSAQLPTPAPSLVEATLGAANVAPTAAQTDVARTLVARLVGEGLALPLNLLGIPGDSPDFVVSAQVFSYIFTLRGDKAWKLPPSTSGAVKVSPLGLRVFEVLTERGAMTAMELAAELGREVTETAILRSLSELWGQLRVIPLIALGDGSGRDGSSTLWELTTRRFTKAIKAGANAGQPTALSALVSLYLAQVFGATEEEVATFLSPLTARSRVREVLHALVGARQLETVVVEGKTLVHIPGTLPEFAAGAEVGEGVEVAAAAVEKPKKVGTGRIKSFTSEEKVASEYRGKPVRSLTKAAGGFKKAGFAGKTGGFAAKAGGFAAKAGAGKFAGKSERAGGFEGKPERERRPFKKASEGGDSEGRPKPSFDKPWEETKPKRTFGAKAAGGAKPAYGAKAGAGKPDSFSKFRRPAAEDRAPLGDREQAGLPAGERVFTKRKYERESTERDERKTLAKTPYSAREGSGEGGGYAAKPRTFGAKPFGAKPFGAKPFGAKPFGAKPFGAKRPYAPREAEGSGAERPAFKPRSYEARGASGFAGKPAFGAKRPYVSRSASSEASAEGARPYAKRPYTPRAEGEGFTKRPYTPRAEGEGFTKRPYTPRTSEGGERSGFAKKPYAARGGGEGFAKKPFAPRAKRSFSAGADDVPSTPVERSIPKRPYKARAADADKRIFTKAPWTPSEDAAPRKNFKSREGGSSRPAGKFAGKRPGGAGPGGFAKRGPAKPFGRKPGAGE